VISRARESARAPVIAVTLGDVRGIGPEIIEKALADETVRASARFLLVGPSGSSLTVDESVGVWPKGGSAADAGRLAGRAIERAVELALNGAVQGIVTAPIDKAALFAGGYDFPGHTEMLAELTNSRVAMMLAATKPNEGMTNPLRVVLATTHMALRDVPAAINEGLLVDVAATTRDGLRDWFGIEHPRIALCAMNPHGGDGGRFGDEDERILTPAAGRADLAGPFPADTVFVRAMKGAFDAVIAPYHDVGMTAIKVAAFGSAVNVTLGLPFPRTSPDHGTALDIAGRGVADPSSMIESMLLAATIARRVGQRGAGARRT